MSSETGESGSGVAALVAWIAVALTAVYLLGFVAIVYSDGRVARALVSVGIPERFLELIYGWLADLLRL